MLRRFLHGGTNTRKHFSRIHTCTSTINRPLNTICLKARASVLPRQRALRARIRLQSKNFSFPLLSEVTEQERLTGSAARARKQITADIVKDHPQVDSKSGLMESAELFLFQFCLFKAARYQYPFFALILCIFCPPSSVYLCIHFGRPVSFDNITDGLNLNESADRKNIVTA